MGTTMGHQSRETPRRVTTEEGFTPPAAVAVSGLHCMEPDSLNPDNTRGMDAEADQPHLAVNWLGHPHKQLSAGTCPVHWESLTHLKQRSPGWQHVPSVGRGEQPHFSGSLLKAWAAGSIPGSAHCWLDPLGELLQPVGFPI